MRRRRSHWHAQHLTHKAEFENQSLWSRRLMQAWHGFACACKTSPLQRSSTRCAHNGRTRKCARVVEGLTALVMVADQFGQSPNPKPSTKVTGGGSASKEVAEAQGFEPWGRSHAQRFSRPPHSTTLPNLRCSSFRHAFAIRQMPHTMWKFADIACARFSERHIGAMIPSQTRMTGKNTMSKTASGHNVAIRGNSRQGFGP